MKWIIAAFLISVLGLSVLLLRNNSTNPPTDSVIENSPTTSPILNINPNDPPREQTIEGEYVCLPHKDSDGPQTLECAFGIRLNDNSYVALDMGNLLHTDINAKLQIGSRIKVSGLYVPIEQINTDMWQKYPLKGIMKVNTIENI